MDFSLVSAVLCIPTVLAFAFQHYKCRGLFISASLPAPLRPPPFPFPHKDKKHRKGGILSYQAFRCVYHVSFILLCRIRLIFLTSFVCDINDPVLVQIGKTSREASRIAAGPPESSHFSGLTNSGEEVPRETERLL